MSAECDKLYAPKFDELKRLYGIQNFEIIKTNQALAWQNRVSMIQLIAILIAIFLVIFAILLRRYELSRAYKDFISWTDNAKEIRSTGLSGFRIVFYYAYPNLFTNPFTNRNFPAACIYSFYSQQFAERFRANPQNLVSMYAFSMVGSPDPNVGEMSALSIICQTWYCSSVAQLKDLRSQDCRDLCQNACFGPNVSSTSSVVSSSVSMGATFGMAGASLASAFGSGASVAAEAAVATGGGSNPVSWIATIVGFVAGVGIGIGTGLYRRSQEKKACKERNQYCASGSGC